MTEALCSVDPCPKPARKDGLCWGHYKRRQLRKPVNVELAPAKGGVKGSELSVLEQLGEAAHAYAEADDDTTYDRARERLHRLALRAGTGVIGELTKKALAKLKAAGVKLGRPRRVDPAVAARLVEELGTQTEAARRLRVSVRSVERALSATRHKGAILSGSQSRPPRGRS